MAAHRIFVPSELLDAWLAEGQVEVLPGELTLRVSGGRFLLEEAVRVLAEVSGARDAQGWVDSVLTVSDVRRAGGTLLERSLLRGDAAYEVEPGFVLAPWGGAPQPSSAMVALFESLGARVSADGPGARGVGNNEESDEALLARYLMRRLE